MKISVCITSYNQKPFLTEAIESVLAQTFKPSQIVLIDDCSTEGSQQLIAGYHSRYPDLITAIYHASNTGIARVRIDALNAVTGDYVTFLDGDDRFLSTKLEKEAALLRENEKVGIAFSNFFFMNQEGVHTEDWAGEERPPQGDVFCQAFARDFPKRILFRSELVHYKSWQEIGFHDPRLRIYEDYDMKIRLTRRLPVIYCEEVLSEYRRHDAGLSRSDPALHLKSLEYIYRKNRPLLDNIGESQRQYVQGKLRSFMSQIARRGSSESLIGKKRLRAVRYHLLASRYDRTSIDWDLVARMLAPPRLYNYFASFKRVVHRML